LAASEALVLSALLLSAGAAAVGSASLLLVAVFAVALAFGVAQPALAATVAASVDAAVRGVALGIATLIFLVGGGVGSALVGGLGPVLGYSRSLLLLLVLPVTGLVLIHHQNGRARN
jgi:MFS family permease